MVDTRAGPAFVESEQFRRCDRGRNVPPIKKKEVTR